MSVPIFQQDAYLIATVPSALADQDLASLCSGLCEHVGRGRVRGVIVDVTALDVMDSFAARMLKSVAQVAQRRGAATVIVGIQPEVAFAMVQLGLSLEEVDTALDLEAGIELLDRKLGAATR